jgi:hypothetical protein
VAFNDGVAPALHATTAFAVPDPRVVHEFSLRDIVTTMADSGAYTRDVELDADQAYIPNRTSMTGSLFGTTLQVGFSFSST